MTSYTTGSGRTTVEWVIVAMVIGVGCIAVFRTFKDSYMQPAAERMGDCIEAAAGDGNLCGGLGSTGPPPGGGGNTAGGAHGAAATVSAATASAATAPRRRARRSAGGGMTAGELADSVGSAGHAGSAPGGPVVAGSEPGHAGAGNPNAETVNRIGWGMGLAGAAEDAAIEAAKHSAGIEGPGAAGIEIAIKGARAAEGAIIAVPLDVIANGVPRTAADAASLATKTAIAGAAVGSAAPSAPSSPSGSTSRSDMSPTASPAAAATPATTRTRLAWMMAHGQAGTIGKDGLAAVAGHEQQMLHDELAYRRQQQELDAQALRQMMGH